MTTTNQNPQENAPLSPCIHAFGIGSKCLSELVFIKYDTNKNGSISFEEFRALCSELEYNLSDDELEWAWMIVDKDGNGMIDYQEFAQWWKTTSRLEYLKMPNEEQTLILCRVFELFCCYDENHTRTLNRTQFNGLHEAFIQEGILDITKHQASDFDEIDLNHDGEIHFNELIAWFKNIGMLNN